MAALFGLLCTSLVWAAPTPFVAIPTGPSAASATTTRVGMEPLLSWFTGEFSSREQAGYDTRFTSAELRLVEIWPGYQGFRWVYAEQFLTERSVRPFRQRIYRFSPVPDGRILMAELMRAVLVKRLHLEGFIVSDYWAEMMPKFAADMTRWQSEKPFVYREDVTEGLENAPSAFIGLLEGRNFGKAVVKVAD